MFTIFLKQFYRKILGIKLFLVIIWVTTNITFLSISNNLSSKICYENIVNLTLYLLKLFPLIKTQIKLMKN